MKPSLIIDVRSPLEFTTGHVKGALNIPYDQIAQKIDSIEGLEKTTPILLYCLSGARSAVACSTLAQRGFTKAMNGGSIATLLMNYERG